MTSSLPSSKPAGTRPRTWIWFFAILTTLAAVGIIVPIVYNLGLQLDPEEVTQARKKWQLKGPSDYVLEYLVKHDRDTQGDQYWVKVRSGRVVSAFRNGEPLELDPTFGLLLGPAIGIFHEEGLQSLGVEGLMDQMAELAEKTRSTSGKRNYATASFNKEDGHPIRFVYRVAGTKTRLEWNLRLRRLDPSSGETKDPNGSTDPSGP